MTSKITKSESQNIEFKETWRDEYLKWICAFANAQGGTLYIGVNDKGESVGLRDAKKLMEDIPNKVRALLGVFVDVNLLIANNLEYLQITVEPYPYPISYKGQYHIRSGSTKQELTGASLDQFLLRKQGKSWDGVPVPQVTYENLEKDELNKFRIAARKSGRIDESVLEESNEALIEKLKLMDGNFLKRAARFL